MKLDWTTVPAGSGSLGLAAQGEGTWALTDVRDLSADCGDGASYSATLTTIIGSSEGCAAQYDCQNCVP